MAGVKIIEGAPLNTPLSELSERDRDIYAQMRASDAIHALHTDCRPLAELMAEAEQVGWLGQPDRDSFITNILLQPVRTIDLALEGLQWFDLSRPVALEDAANKGKLSERLKAAAMRTDGNVLPEGRPNKETVQIAQFPAETRAEDVGISLRTQRKLDALARRAPDLLDEVKAGRMSAHSAAIAAGIVKQTTPLDTLRRAWRKASEEERAQFRDEIDTPVMDQRFG